MAFNPFSGDPLTPLDGSLEKRSSRCLNGRVGCTINCIPFGPRVFCQVLINSRKTGIGSRVRSARTRVDEIVERRWLAARALRASGAADRYTAMRHNYACDELGRPRFTRQTHASKRDTRYTLQFLVVRSCFDACSDQSVA